jgi:hypothetical protein
MNAVNECIVDIGRAGSTIRTILTTYRFSIPRLGQFECGVGPVGLLGCPASFQQIVELEMAGLANIIV